MPHLILPALLTIACGDGKPGGDSGGASADGGQDVDCPTPSTWYVDADGDGYGAGDPVGEGCVRPDGQVANDDDCDDGDAAVSPAGAEVCNGIDDDCDGEIDPTTAEGVMTCWRDGDGDGYGAEVSVVACDCPDGYAASSADCDDSDPQAHPGADEILYDGIDEDCLGMQGEYDADGDGYDWDGATGVDGVNPTDCDDTDPSVHPDVWDDCADDIDQDCDGVVDECGVDTTMTAADAWLQVYRNPEPGTEPVRALGFMGMGLVDAGDSDGDGDRELIAPVTERDGSGALRYRLVDVPAHTAGGRVEVGEVTLASWEVPSDDVNWLGTTWKGDDHVVAGQDLDGDGLGDYVFLSTGGAGNPGTPDGGPQGRVDFWSGPASGDLSMDDADSLEYPVSSGVIFSGGLSLLQPAAEGEDWTLAATLWPRVDADEGTEHSGVALVTPGMFTGAASLNDGITIDTTGGNELEHAIETDDLDGDGVGDILVASARANSDVVFGRVLVFAGPVDSERTLDDAELTIAGLEPDDDFGDAFSTIPPGDTLGGEGRILARGSGGDAATSSVFSLSVASLDAPVQRTAADADARIDFASDFIPYSPHRMVGDVDADGVDELGLPGDDRDGGRGVSCVLLMEPPASGVVSSADGEALLCSDEPRGGELFGSSLVGGADWDGDGAPDLVIGEQGWAGTESGDLSYGRFVIFRGEVAGR